MKVIYWLQIFIVPVIIMGLIAIFTYSTRSRLAIALVVIGVLLGICFAEYVRRKYGLEKFFARLYSNEQDRSDPKGSCKHFSDNTFLRVLKLYLENLEY